MTDRSQGTPPGWRPILRLPFAAKRVAEDVDQEIAFHLAMRAERLRAKGLNDADARAAAEHRFGDVSHVRQEMVAIDTEIGRRRSTMDYLEDLVKDLVF